MPDQVEKSDRIGGAMQGFQEHRFTMSASPGGNPKRELSPELEALVSTQPTMPTDPLDRLSIPVITKEGLTRGMGMEATDASSFQNYVQSLLGSDNEAQLRQQVMQYAMDHAYEPALRRALLDRSLSYYKSRGVAQGNGARIRAMARGLTPESKPMKVDMQKGEDFHIAPAEHPQFHLDLEKAEGDRGGHVIGHTSTGKPLYKPAFSGSGTNAQLIGQAHAHATEAGLNLAEHKEAQTFHKRASVAAKTLGLTDQARAHQAVAGAHSVAPHNPDMVKAAPLGGKYAKRVTSDEGKHRYFYSEEAYRKSPGAHIAGADILRDRIRKEVRDRVAANPAPPGGWAADHLGDLSSRYGAHEVRNALQAVLQTGPGAPMAKGPPPRMSMPAPAAGGKAPPIPAIPAGTRARQAAEKKKVLDEAGIAAPVNKSEGTMGQGLEGWMQKAFGDGPDPDKDPPDADDQEEAAEQKQEQAEVAEDKTPSPGGDDDQEKSLAKGKPGVPFPEHQDGEPDGPSAKTSPPAPAKGPVSAVQPGAKPADSRPGAQAQTGMNKPFPGGSPAQNPAVSAPGQAPVKNPPTKPVQKSDQAKGAAGQNAPPPAQPAVPQKVVPGQNVQTDPPPPVAPVVQKGAGAGNTQHRQEKSMTGLAGWMQKGGIPYTEGAEGAASSQPGGAAQIPNTRTGGGGSGIPYTDGTDGAAASQPGGNPQLANTRPGSGQSEGIPGASDPTTGADPDEVQTGDPPDQGLNVGANNGEQLDSGTASPPADGAILARTGPGRENDLEGTTGSVADGGTDNLGDAPKKVAELPTGGPPMELAMQSADDVAADVASRMDVKGNGVNTLGKSQTVTPRDELAASMTDRARKVATLRKGAVDVRVGQGVAGPVQTRPQPHPAPGEPLYKAMTTDDMVEHVMKGDGYYAQTPPAGMQNALSRKTMCKACHTEVPEMFKAGACPSCGSDMQKSLLPRPIMSPAALRPLRNADVYAPHGVKLK